MSQITVYKLDGSEAEKIELSDKLFNQTASPALVYQVVRVAALRRRQPLAHTKDRSDVSGGGKKPWKQKGTGRARHGSIRSPLWRGGGITFGPRSDSGTTRTIPKKMAKKALLAVLSDRAAHKNVLGIDLSALEKPSTKKLILFLETMKRDTKNVLFITTGAEDALAHSLQNIKTAQSVRVENVNILDILAAHTLCLTQDALAALTKQLGA